jgi:DNA-binding IclR family transcriptional regulator
MSSVARVFRILETVVSHQGRGLAYSEVVARTQLPKATTHRVLKSLVRTGYLRFDAGAGRYFGDLKLAFLGSAVTSNFNLKSYVRPYLLKLQTETTHTCNLGVLSGDVGVYLDKIESPEAYGIKLYSEIGKPFPLHSTGMGKILLAGMEPAEVRRILAGELEAYTPHTITKPEALRRELAKVRRCGYALDREEITRGIVCVAAPIRNGEGDTVAAISIAFPAYINEERGIKGEIAAVTRCASEVTRLLGGTPGGGGASRRDVGRRAPAAKKRG